ncbi:MAG: L-lactate dehydrogenase [Acidobacteria bacterium]|nr:L-lactate dehydrogenase [Acidobacteriota bacterium]
MPDTLDRKPIRIAVVGTGNVGSSFAYALLLSGLAAEIVLVDASKAKAEGEAMDLNHAVPFAPNVNIWSGDYADCAGAIVTVVSAGVNQKPGETRLDLLRRNAAVFSDIVPNIVKYNRDGVLLIATNPVDILTYTALKLSGLASCQVIGSGTILDTARFRHLLSRYFNVDPRSVHAYIIGEHGDSEVPVWSLANIAGMRLPEFSAAQSVPCDNAAMDDIFKQVSEAAYQIISRKGATYYAVAAGLMRIVEAIVRDQRTVLSVSSLMTDYYGISDICLSLPTVVNRRGIESVLRLKLDDREVAGLQRSAEVLRQTAKQLDIV